ncbi:hypothetical protein PHO31112_05013 [Pandoraea horticolens]|uniref:Uncharacterized protein n=1 Tax=Pandoraea horticolens TaxID=2508298 RepID=A0A5E4Z4F6_9BURK|nr:hypothetical protein PHO31112_05013 [Pandoraea horticolens]
MVIAPNWFLYAGYLPPDGARLFSVAAVAYAIALSHRSLGTRLAQHRRISRWFCLSGNGERKLPN